MDSVFNNEVAVINLQVVILAALETQSEGMEHFFHIHMYTLWRQK